MILYLAGGFGMLNTKGKEIAMLEQCDTWHRLYSFHFTKELENSQIFEYLKNKKNGDKNKRIAERPGNRKTRTRK